MTVTLGRLLQRPCKMHAAPQCQSPIFDVTRLALPETVEALWAPIAEQDDWQLLYSFIDDIRSMGAALAGRMMWRRLHRR